MKRHWHSRTPLTHSLDFWMIMELLHIVTREDQRRIETEFGKALGASEAVSQSKLKEFIETAKKNRFHPVGKTSLISQRLQEMHDDVASILNRKGKFLFVSADMVNIHEGDITFYLNSKNRIVSTKAPRRPKSTVKHFSSRAAALKVLDYRRALLRKKTGNFGF